MKTGHTIIVTTAPDNNNSERQSEAARCWIYKSKGPLLHSKLLTTAASEPGQHHWLRPVKQAALSLKAANATHPRPETPRCTLGNALSGTDGRELM